MTNNGSRCKIDGCKNNSAYGRAGMCHAHYVRNKNGQDMSAPIKGSVKCKAEGCELKIKAKGYCRFHYRRWMKGIPFDIPRHHRVVKGECKVPECSDSEAIAGYCKFHYGRQKYGIPFDKKRKAPAGSVYVTPNGYAKVTINGKAVSQHRHIMQEYIGRALERHETVHHINGVRDDNRIENLELWSSRQPYGQRVIDKVKWAKEILAKYEGILDKLER